MAMANQIEQRALKLLIERWNAIKTHLNRLNMPNTRPDDGQAIFALIDYPKTAGEIGFKVKSVVFNLPESANGRADLFVVVRGRLYFDEAAVRDNKLLRTLNFGTEAAYFRKKGNELAHVYGAHYDFALNKIGHPAFHAQMKSYAERFHKVAEYFDMAECTTKDLVEGVLRTVRLPSAQMDFFSFVLQLCADHLMHEKSGKEDQAAFGDLRVESAAIHGAAYRVPQLANPAAQACLRANHWYP